MELGGDVREEDERRRRDARLRRVEDAHLRCARAGGRVHRGDRLDEPVQLAGVGIRFASALRRPCRWSRATLPAPLAGRGRDVQDRRVVEELHLPAQLLVELLRELRAAALHQVPLVRHDDDAAAGLLRLPARWPRPGRWRPPWRRPRAPTTSASSIARFATSTLTASTWPPTAPRGPAAACRRCRRCGSVRRCQVSRASTASRVVPGMSLTIDTLFPQEPIEQRGLAHVRASDDGDRGFPFRASSSVTA